jgi:hypothetical protein
MANDEKIEGLKREAEAERRAIAKAIGIERDFGPLVTIYNSPGRTMVASVERYSPDIYERRLFFRGVSDRTYNPIPSPSPEIHYHDPITSQTLPVIYYSASRVTKDDPTVDSTAIGCQWTDLILLNAQERVSSPQTVYSFPLLIHAAGFHNFIASHRMIPLFSAPVEWSALKKAR